MKAQKILVPIDFSPQSRLALEEADVIAAASGGELTLLHVHQIVQLAVLEFSFSEPPARVAQIIEAAERELREWSSALKTPQERVNLRVETGQPVAVINEFSERADLIVMPTHGRTGPSHFFLGSVAERVVQGSKCSVLVVKQNVSPA